MDDRSFNRKFFLGSDTRTIWTRIRTSFLTPFVVASGLTVLVYSCATPQNATPPPTKIQEEPRPEGVVDVDGAKNREIPKSPYSWQKRPPCDPDSGEVVLEGACYVELKKLPPCGRALKRGNACYQFVIKGPRPPTSISE